MTCTPFRAFENAAHAVQPQVAVVLGSGMGDVVSGLQRQLEISFGDIPGFPAASVAGHRGRLSLGVWGDTSVLVFEGRLHFYEDHSWDLVVAPVRLAHALGARRLVLTNAAGGIRDDLQPGSLMLIRDHLEWTRPYCWREPGPGGVGPSRPSPYSDGLARAIRQAGKDVDIEVHEGIYAALTGPCYETPAEIRALKIWGADAVGMSTAREIQTGYDLGMHCAAISCITNKAAGLSGGPLNHQDVLRTAARQGQRLRELLEQTLRSLHPRDTGSL